MRLTVGKAKEYLASKSPADRLEFRLARAQERLILHGKYQGALQRIVVAAIYGQIALPPAFRTIEGVQVGGRVYELANRWWTYLPGKGDAFPGSLNVAYDLGDGFATMYELPLGGRDYTSPTITLSGGGGSGATASATVLNRKIYSLSIDTPGSGYTSAPTVVITDSTGSGAAATAYLSGDQVTQIASTVGGTLTVDYPGSGTLVVTIYGEDARGLAAELTFTGKQTLANPFNNITRCHKDMGDVVVTLFHTAPNGDSTPMAILEPTDEESFVRRYRIDSLRDEPMTPVKALVKIRHREFTSDSDVMLISNLSALSLALDAENMENENDQSRANELWDKAIDILNSELADSRGTNEIPTLQILYPGSTQPQLISFY